MKYGVAEGHNTIHNSGAQGLVLEDELTYEVSEEVMMMLDEMGHDVVDLVTSNTDGLRERVAKANAEDVDLAVFIHFNAYNGSARGTEVCQYKPTELGENVVDAIAELGYVNRGVKVRRDLYVLRHTDMPAILIECCFCDNPSDMALYNKTEMAKAIVYGITGEHYQPDEIDWENRYKVLLSTMREVVNNG